MPGGAATSSMSEMTSWMVSQSVPHSTTSERGCGHPSRATTIRIIDDGAATRAVPVGIRYAGHPTEAAEVAARLASITNAEDALPPAQAMAVTVSWSVAGVGVEEAIDAGIAQVPKDSGLVET